MTNRVIAAIGAAIIIAGFAAGAWALTQIPAGHQVATHFDVAGRPNGWSRAPIAFFILPVVNTAVMAMWFILPRVTPRGDNLRRSSTAFGVIILAVSLVVCFAQATIILTALGYRVAIGGAMPAAIGVMLIVIGNVLPKLRWNYVVGIRTPWTLASERVWDKTHRFGGWVMVAGGAVMLIGSMIPPYLPKPGLIAGVIGSVALLTVGKSYLLWRDEERAKTV